MSRDELLASFIEEAAEVLSGLESGLAELGRSPADPGQVEALGTLAHRLRGSAGLYGYPQLAAMAGLLERLLEADLAWEGEGAGELVAALAPLMAALRGGLEGLRAGQGDGQLGLSFMRSGGAAQLERLLRERPGRFGARPRPGWAQPDEMPEENPEAPGLSQGLRAFVRSSPEVWDYFGPEVREHLGALREQLGLGLAGPGGPGGSDLNVMFRAAHTVKGSSYMVGLPELGDFAHRLEDLLGALREEAVSPTAEVAALLSEGVDRLEDFLAVASGEAPGEALEAQLPGLQARLRAAATGESLSNLSLPGLPSPGLTVPGLTVPGLTVPGQPSPAGAQPMPATGAGPLPTGAPSPAPAPAVAASIRVPATRLEGLLEQLGELVTARARLTRLLGRMHELESSMAGSQERFGRTVRDFEERYLNPGVVTGSEATAPGGRAPGTGLDLSQQFAELEFDTYNDLNILSRSITELAADFSEVRRHLGGTLAQLDEENDQLGKLLRRLRTDLNQTTRVAFSQATARLRRWAREQGESFDLHVSGEDVLIESATLQRLTDPMLHLLTNAVYHGLSQPGERVAAGKPARGNVWVQASQASHYLEVMVADDGWGLDYPRIRERALERGLRSAQELAAMPPQELARLILLPGFSTAQEVGQVAGRGVGLDVVATAVRQLGGELLIGSEPGVGTAFTLRLPTTQRVTDVLRVGLQVPDEGGDESQRLNAAFPVGLIRGLRDLPAGDLRRGQDGALWAPFEGAYVPYLDLRPLWGAPAPERAERTVVFAGTLTGTVALEVAEFGQLEEVAVTALSPLLGHLDYLAGVATLGSGEAVPLLDAGGLQRLARRPEAWLGTRQGGMGRPRRLLLADDSLSVRRLVSRMLERGGYVVETANDGQEALEKLQAGGEYDAVLTDLEMPRMNGYELLSAVRSQGRQGERLPVLVMTTRVGEKHQQLAFELGADDYFSKPVNETLLLRRLGALSGMAEAPA